MSGTIAYCTREDHSLPLFAAQLAQLAQRHPDAKITCMVGTDIAASRNAVVKTAEGDWLWFVDPDQIFPPDTLERLLAHEVDVVQVLCLMRHPPHDAIVWADDLEEKTGTLSGPPRLLDVKVVGAGGTLYRRRVFERIPAPWFEGPLGQEDTTFAHKLREAGFRLCVDLATPVGHLTPMMVWPHFHRGEWLTRYDAMNGEACFLPARRLVEERR